MSTFPYCSAIIDFPSISFIFRDLFLPYQIQKKIIFNYSYSTVIIFESPIIFFLCGICKLSQLSEVKHLEFVSTKYRAVVMIVSYQGVRLSQFNSIQLFDPHNYRR